MGTLPEEKQKRGIYGRNELNQDIKERMNVGLTNLKDAQNFNNMKFFICLPGRSEKDIKAYQSKIREFGGKVGSIPEGPELTVVLPNNVTALPDSEFLKDLGITMPE
ncbi:hypothetical protein COB52_06075 [Candidatus Kaiserbacteria bacterium]|nr:MAG: hypothetical protein COB52_06075 [Candidatus Kaiserbacteria bacterium]